MTNRIAELWAAGHSTRVIADLVVAPKSTVARICKELPKPGHKIPRSRGENKAFRRDQKASIPMKCLGPGPTHGFRSWSATRNRLCPSCAGRS